MFHALNQDQSKMVDLNLYAKEVLHEHVNMMHDQ